MSVPNNEKNRAENSVFFEYIFYLILEGFWGGFGRALGGKNGIIKLKKKITLEFFL